MKIMSRYFPFITGLRDLLLIADAQIVTSKGESVLSNEKQMKKVNEAIENSDRKGSQKSITVKL